MLRTLSKLRPIFHNTIQRTSNPDDFFIELNDPHKTFSPGSVVDGSVVLVLAKPQKVSSIVCTIQGTIMIRNTLVKTKAVKHILFEETVVLWGEETEVHDKLKDDKDITNAQAQNISTSSTTSTLGQNTTDTCNSSIRSGRSAKSTKSAKSNRSTKSIKSTRSTESSGNLSIPMSSDGIDGSAQPSSEIPSHDSSSTMVSNELANRTRAITMSTTSSTNSITSNDNSSISSSNAQPLPRGEHLFGFEFVLPEKGLFNSLEFERGAISYTITTTCHRSSPPTIVTAQKALSVICPIDIAALPPPKVSTLTVDVHKKRKGHGSIIVAVSLPRKGYLRGDSVPVKISVQHIKHVKHLSGIITTLSRISIVSAQGSEAQSFRKDLSQTISPLYTDPATFRSNVTANIRIPPDTFPTTKGHDDISFQYCIEVVLDLSGKRSIDLGASGRDNDIESSKVGFIDTDKVKKGRGVVNLWTEVIIGTHNGGGSDLINGGTSESRSKLKGKDNVTSSITASTSTTLNDNATNNRYSSFSSSVGNSSYPPRTTESPQSASSTTMYNVLRYDELAAAEAEAISSTSDSNIAGNGGLSEKETLRQMEEAILPSDPPHGSYYQHRDGSNHHDVPAYAIAPHYDDNSSTSSLPPQQPEIDHNQPSAPPAHLVMASAPTYSNADEAITSSSSTSQRNHLPDKAELERARLESIVSVPDEEYVPKYEPLENNVDEPSAPTLPPDLSSHFPTPQHHYHHHHHHHHHHTSVPVPDPILPSQLPSLPPKLSEPSSPPQASHPLPEHEEPSAPILPDNIAHYDEPTVPIPSPTPNDHENSPPSN